MSMPITRLSLKHLQILRQCKRFLTSNLLLVNTGTCCAIYTVGDLIEQRIEGREKRDWARTARMAILGFCLGPVNHCWYITLDKVLPGIAAKTVGKKVLADQIMFAPVHYTIFYMGMCLLEGKKRQEMVNELKMKFWPTYKMDWKVWPAAQVINFFFIPPSLRVTYVNIVTLGWTVYLSCMKHKDIQKP